jgi:hypothetical protein
MRASIWTAAAVLIIGAGLFPLPAANAQVQSPSPGLSEQSPNISEQKLDAAAAGSPWPPPPIRSVSRMRPWMP